MPTAEQQLRALYARVPRMKCKPGCHDCCGPIPMTALEYSRLFKTSADSAVGQFPVAADPKTGCCPLISPITGQCTAYERRPLICRMFGVTEGLACPHVAPAAKLSAIEADSLLFEVERISVAAAAEAAHA